MHFLLNTMAVFTQFFSIIIPIANIERCTAIGGFKGILELQKQWIGKKVLYDEYIYKDGAMGGGIDTIIDFWEQQGLVMTETINGQEQYKDFCLIDIGNPKGIAIPCPWLEYEAKNGGIGIAWMKGKPKGGIVLPTRLKKSGFMP